MRKKKGTTKNQKNQIEASSKVMTALGLTERMIEDMGTFYFQGWGVKANVLNCQHSAIAIALTVAITNSTVADYNHSSTVITFTTVANNFFAVDMHLCTIMW